MIPMVEEKWVWVAAPTALVDNAAVTTTEVDTNGYDYATFVVHVGTTDIALTDLVVQETDTSGSGYTDIAATDFTATTYDIEGSAVSLPSATDDGTNVVIGINLVGKKRYLDIDITVGNGTNGGWYYCVCRLSRARARTLTNANVAGTGGVAIAAS